MTKSTFGTVTAGILAIGLLTGCSGDRTPTSTHVTAEERNEFVNNIEQKLEETEARLNQAKTQDPDRTGQLGNAENEINKLRGEIQEVKNTTAENWWATTRRSLNRNLAQLSQKIDPTLSGTEDFADRMRTESDTAAEPHTENFEAERDAYVTRMQAQIDALEQKLNETKDQAAATRSHSDHEHWDEVKGDLENLKESVAELKTTGGDDWWDYTKSRIERTRNNVEESIDRNSADRVNPRPGMVPTP